MAYEIRELSITGILNQAIDVLTRNILTLLIIMSVLSIPLGLVQAVLNPFPALGPDAGLSEVKPERLIAYFVVLMFYSLAAVVSNAAIIYAISDAYLGNKPNVGTAFGRAFKRLGPLVWTWILVAAAIMGGFILFIIPGIIAALWFSLATQVVVLEPHSGFAAMKRSRELMRGNIGKYFGLMLLVGLLGLLMGVAFGTVAALFQSDISMKIAEVLVSAVQTLFASAVAVVFYFSARCKYENFDLELLANSLAEPVEENPYAASNP